MNSARKNFASAVAVAGMVGALALPVQAEEAWEFELTPYLWAAGIEGDAGIRGREVEVDASFDDILDNLDMAGAFLMRAERNNWVVWTQFDYIAVGSDVPDQFQGGGKLDSDTLMATVGFGRNFESANGRRSLDVLIGGRILSLDNTLKIGNPTQKFSRDGEYIDPVLILRPSLQLSKRWRFNPTMSFGAGGDSEKTYELQPQLQFQMTDTWAFRFGYRKLHYDIEDNSNGNFFDAAFQGPFIGFGGTFGGAPEPVAAPAPEPVAPPPQPAVVAQPKDSDGDGVIDDKDMCPGTPAGQSVDSVGCQSDFRLEIQFDSDSTVIKPEYFAELDRIVDILKRVPTISGVIEGHSDSTASDAYNQSLSERRAASVVKYAVDHGIDSSRIEAKGFGESRPITSNDTVEGRAQNRRVVLNRTDAGS